MTTATHANERISESLIQSKGLKVDREKAIIYGVAVLNEVSKNSRLYESKARQEFASVLNRNEGHPVAYEHENMEAVLKGKGIARKALERNGQLRKARAEGSSVFADWHLNKDKPETQSILTDAEEFPSNLCLSPEFDSDHYEATVGNDGLLHVHTITDALDVAVVSRGGTTSSLKEHHQKEPQMSDSAVVEKAASAAAAAADKRLAESEERRRIQEQISGLEAKVSNLEAANKRLTEERDAAQSKLDQLAKVDRIVEQAKSKYDLEIEPSFARTLAPLDDEAIDFHLKDRKRLLENASKSKPEKKSNHFKTSVSDDESEEEFDEVGWLPTTI